ncbi:MAG: hypothetical protein NTW26_08150 [bacterium]|nr:hypothetical protein [bacterium]
MKRILVVFLAVLFLLCVSGCSKELNDENFVAFFLELGTKDDPGADFDKVLDSYGWSAEDFETYVNKLIMDEGRVNRIRGILLEENMTTALAFQLFVVDQLEKRLER